MIGPWGIVAGASMMLWAVVSDPWGKSKIAAGAYILGAALFIAGFAGL